MELYYLILLYRYLLDYSLTNRLARMRKFFELVAFHVILISIRVTQIDLLLDNNVSNCIWSGIVRSGIVGVELSGVELWEWNCPVIKKGYESNEHPNCFQANPKKITISTKWRQIPIENRRFSGK